MPSEPPPVRPPSAGRASRVAVELVPRSVEKLREELELLREVLPGVDTVNVPDLLRFDLRSWDACAVASGYVARPVPHLRAIDLDPDRPLPFREVLEETGVREVLVVAGDAPVDMGRPVYDTSTPSAIRRVRREMPGVQVWAALDPYRQDFRRELEYAERKLEAGACGFFTQPFFDLRLMDVWAELLEDLPGAPEVFWGVTSVTSDRQVSYWRTRNRAVFPRAFEPTLAWNRTFARDAAAFVRDAGAHVYFMPIRARIDRWLEGVLEPFSEPRSVG